MEDKNYKKTFSFSFSLDAWVQGVEIDAYSKEEALEELSNMTIDELIEEGYVKGFELKDIDSDVIYDEEAEEKEIEENEKAWRAYWQEDEEEVDEDLDSKTFDIVEEKPATEDDWDKLIERIPYELAFDDLDVEVCTASPKFDSDGNPTTPDRRELANDPEAANEAEWGKINHFLYTLDDYNQCVGLVSEFLGKDVSEITNVDLLEVKLDEFEDWFRDNKVDIVKEAAKKAWVDYDIEYDEVDWD